MMMAAPLLFQGRLFAQEVDQNKSTPYTHQDYVRKVGSINY